VHIGSRRPGQYGGWKSEPQPRLPCKSSTWRARLPPLLKRRHGQRFFQIAQLLFNNSRNGTRTKTVLTEVGPVEIDVPRDTGSTFDPQIVKKRRRLTGVDEIVLSLSAKGLTTGEIAAHFAEVFGARVSKDTVSRITEKVIGEMTDWQPAPGPGLSCAPHRRDLSSWSATGRSPTGQC
jgi:hypothetical protein